MSSTVGEVLTLDLDFGLSFSTVVVLAEAAENKSTVSMSSGSTTVIKSSIDAVVIGNC